MPVDFLSALHHLASHNLRRDPSIASIEARHSGTAQGNISSGPRRIHVNVPLPKDHVDARGNPLRSWTTNKVKTSKYSLLTFLPKNLFEQFRRLANFFFLTITIIQFFPDFQQIEPIVAALPLIIIVFLTAVKDGIEDWRRHVSDSQLNGKLVYTLRGGNWRNVNVEEYSDTGWGARLRATFVTGTTWVLGAVVQSATMMWNWATKLTAHSESGDSGRPSESGSRSASFHLGRIATNLSLPQIPGLAPPSSPSPGSRKPTLAFLPPTPTNLDTPHFLQVSWRSLLPGDIILLRGNEDVPCDVLALASSDESGVVYVETKNLDGETNLKIRRCMGETAHLRPDERGMSSLRTCKFWVETEPPNESVHNFNGAMVWCVDKETPTAMEQSATGQHHDPSQGQLSMLPEDSEAEETDNEGGSGESGESAGAVDSAPGVPDNDGSGTQLESPNIVDLPALSEGFSAMVAGRLGRRATTDGILRRKGNASGPADAAQEITMKGDQLLIPAARKSPVVAGLRASGDDRSSTLEEAGSTIPHTSVSSPPVKGVDGTSSPSPKETRLPISMSNLLLRGCAVRNTQWVLCLVLFTGEETRVRLNAGPTRSKRSRVEIRMNQHIAVNLALILFMCLWCTIGLLQTSSWVSWDWVVPDAGGASWGWYGFVTFLNGLIQFQNILPMPLYLTVEIVKSFQAFFIHQDREMYYEDGERSVGCTPKSWNLGDDLGQIEYIFSDKTGTLTRNVMDFKRCSINGYAYTGGTLGTDGASVKKSPRVSQSNSIAGTASYDESVPLSSAPASPVESLPRVDPRFTTSTSRDEKLEVSSVISSPISFPPPRAIPVLAITSTDTGSRSITSQRLSSGGGEHGGLSVTAERLTSTGTARSVTFHHTVSAPFIAASPPAVHYPPVPRPYASGALGTFSDERILSLLARGYSENFVGNQEWMIQAKRMKEFFTVLAVCHSVVVSGQDGEEAEDTKVKVLDEKAEPSQVVKVVRELRYRAQSPDEAALVDAAKNLGIAFLGRKVNTVILDVFGKQEQYEILNVLEFNSTRKRMSVVVRRPDGVLSLFCKGADSVVMGRMATGQKEIVDVTSMHLDAFAEEGLRTLCLATVELTEKGYKDWEREHQEASASIIDRESKVDSVAEKLEQNLILLGATAIEDKLQEGVPETISTLSKAGIKIWVLTGDKMETAINIAFSCNLLDKEMTLIMIRGPSGSGAEDIQNETRPIRQQVASALATYFTKPARSWFGRSDSQCDPPQKRALIIDGYALKHALEPKTKAMLLELACRCTAVVCCRVSPLQKAEVVRLVKDSKGVMCLAIGDGANDVSMIQAAQVGVGIAGEEGLQAAMSSDYAIAQFRYLTRLLLVHGRWNYWRTGEMIFNFFFKNIIWTLPTFWFQIYCAYSSGINIEYTYLMFYQTLFTALSPIAIGIFDKDIDSVYALAVPQIYGSGVRGEVYTNGRFLLYCVQGLYQSVVVFFVPIYVYDEGPDHPRGYAADGFLVGACVAITAIVNANAYMLYGCHSWTYIIHGVFLLHVGIVYLYAGIFSLDPNTQTYGAYELGYGSLKFWLTFAICTALCQLPRVMYLYIMRNYMPTDVNIVAELQKMCKPVDLATGVSRSGTKRSVWDLDVEAVQESGNQHLGTPLDIDFLRRQMSQPSPPGGVSPSSKRTSSDQNHSPSSDETSTSMSPSSILAPTPRKIRDMRTEEGYLHDRGFSFAHDKGTTAIIMGTPTLLKKIISECEIAEDGGTNDKSQQMRHRKRGHKRHASEKMKDPSMNQNESSLTSKGSSQPERSEDGAQRQVVPRLKSAPPARLGARAKADGVARTTGDLLNIS